MKTRALPAATVTATAFISRSCGGNPTAKQDSGSEKTAAGDMVPAIDSTQVTDTTAPDTTGYLLRKDGAWHLFSTKGKLIEPNFTLHPANHFMAG